ncbi:MAG: SPFH domain-containing protein [Bacillota bacterium]
MNEVSEKNIRVPHSEEILIKGKKGMPVLLLNILAVIVAFVAFISGIIILGNGTSPALGAVLLAVGIIYGFIAGPILFLGLKILKPNEALVLTLFGKYYGTLKGEGFYFVNPFVSALNPATATTSSGVISFKKSSSAESVQVSAAAMYNKKISLKAMTLNNEKQKVNDLLGNPIEIGIVVIWRVVNTAKAVFNVDNYAEFLSIQCDSALRNTVRLYPYDISDSDNEQSLRGSSQIVADNLKNEIQSKVEVAGLEILEARITHLSYAPEIAAVMLQRQQATAIIQARQMIVEGAVSMVEMALDKLNQNEVVDLDEERKAAMVSNLLVILCGNRDAQPIVNSGSLY